MFEGAACVFVIRGPCHRIGRMRGRARSGPGAPVPAMADPLCVYCRKRPVDPAWRPFCSERCKMADLGRWLGGEYRVPGDTGPHPAGETPDEEDDSDR